MARYAGDFQGTCGACDEYVEFALGVGLGNDPVAMHFGPGGPQPIDLTGVELELMVENEVTVRFKYVCPLCGQRSAGRATCRFVGRRPTEDEN